MTNVADEKLYLHAERDGDLFIVKDQNGRVVEFQRSVSIYAGVDLATEVTLCFYDASEEKNKVHVNNKSRP